MGEHRPYIVEEDRHDQLPVHTYRAECPCGWAGITWGTRENAAIDVGRHAARDQRDAGEPARVE